MPTDGYADSASRSHAGDADLHPATRGTAAGGPVSCVLATEVTTGVALMRVVADAVPIVAFDERSCRAPRAGGPPRAATRSSLPGSPETIPSSHRSRSGPRGRPLDHR